MQYEQTFNAIDNILRNEAGCSTELNYLTTFGMSGYTLSNPNFRGYWMKIGKNSLPDDVRSKGMDKFEINASQS